ncbi:MAG: hypothetical protein K2W93_09000 [Burkholderiaceae bacterium]|nr:hypothetical protein [Burkholderiaceae bacterium]
MRIDPPNLNIPLHRKSRLPLAVLVCCAAANTLAWFVDRDIALSFFASTIVFGPAIWLYALPPNWLVNQLQDKGIPRFIGLALLFVYLSAAKTVLVPFLLSVLGRNAA